MKRDPERARRIVRLAATHVKDPSTRSWLLADERGTFEKLAEEYLDKTSARAAQLEMSADEVDDEIATVIGLRALTAQLEHQKKRKRR
jgi:hypothetical protein